MILGVGLKRKQNIMDNCGELKVNLGCGFEKKEGWIGLDKGNYGQEIIRDMKNGLPFCDNSCSELYCDQVLEHIQLNEDFIFIMNECLRVLKPQGRFKIQVPHWDSFTMKKDPTHCRNFDEQTFTYLEAKNGWDYGFDKKWEIEKCERVGDHLLVTLIADK